MPQEKLVIVFNPAGPYEAGGGCVKEDGTFKEAKRPGLTEGIIATLFPLYSQSSETLQP